MTAGPLLLYDGVCALCNGAVRFVLRRDRTERSRFCALDGDTAASVLSEHPGLSGIDSMIWIDAAGTAHVKSDAVIAIGRYLGGPWKAASGFAAWTPRWLRDGVYDVVARIRYRLFGRYDVCPVPPPQFRARFLP